MAQKQFLKADQISNKIKKLKAKELRAHKKGIQLRQMEDLQMLEDSHRREIADFNQIWNEKFEEYKEACRNGEVDLKEKQQESFKARREELMNKVPVIPKHSSRILDLRKMQDAVIKQKDYKEAHSLQVQLDGLQDGNQEKWQEERNEKIEKKLAEMARKQEVEVDNYRKKALSGFNELKKLKSAELEALVKRYNNAKQDLMGAQKIENSRLEMSMRVCSDVKTISKIMNTRTERFTPHASIAEGDN